MSDRKRIFLLSGKQGAGKTTYAQWIRAYLGLGESVLMNFADPLYEMHHACLPILKRYELRPKNMDKDGELLQVLGTEYGRRLLGDNCWVETMQKNIKKFFAHSPHAYVIVGDCRFPNEFDAFEDSAHIIRLSAPEEMRKKRCSYWREKSHESELALDDYEAQGKFKVVIKTDGASSPKHQVEMLLKQLGYIE